ncbi:TetR/AcrR family transcriptional regulator [Streptomyces clavuligerus]|uniref:Putative TetR-family transcriptional regulator n=2 Tax=Streptomyces clavuligerus TaxID=1901 RepID=E2PUC4_STRCL|nr:TetR/AcrR family transcriptional regulator [Streptomyces clavuligerus]EFG05743.1 Putative TetR-family transcriptional regulator [Streptomyces clavuligerus]MBY6305905.1 TetR/AcrR family transcriptional regulator [Streptomyces clavuligerus]QCS08564.1 TetR/AcrR family transcriptional regulator [Streptomyces clavuligerus]QPJ92101.1 TetR family transcriptional regulator [Streptomyces clavuligerus]
MRQGSELPEDLTEGPPDDIRRATAEQPRGRRAELIAVGRKLFAHTPYDALSMDDIARQAGVAKGLIYYYFASKRGYYLAIVEDSVAGLVSRARDRTELPGAERVRRTVDGYLRYAQNNGAAFRTITSGGVGFDPEVQSLRDSVREELTAAIAEGAYGTREIPPTARLALVGWLGSVEQIALEWLAHPAEPGREQVCELLTRLLAATLATVGEFEPGCPCPPLEGIAPPVPKALPGVLLL